MVGSLWHNEVADTEHERAADRESGNLLSGSGLLYVPSDVLQMIFQAIKVGYAVALKQIQDGYYDDNILEWRPDLSEA